MTTLSRGSIQVRSTGEFKTEFSHNIFRNKYAIGPDDTWANLAIRLVDDVCGSANGNHPILSTSEREYLIHIITNFKFIPGGRYLYYAGRSAHFWNNCYLLRAEEDTREEWGNVTKRAMDCLMSGGGIGIDYSRLRGAGRQLSRTGGTASGPIPLMFAINEIGRNVMQGGSRRSAIYASLNWNHSDVEKFLICKNWKDIPIHEGYSMWDGKNDNFNFSCPLDMTNISLNYDNSFLENLAEYGTPHPLFVRNVLQALMTGEPGFSFNFGEQENETLRNACTEVCSEDDSDVCNLGSINMGEIDSLDEFRDIVNVASKLLVCGTVRAELPYQKVHDVREKNRRLGLGLMGMHEWLLKKGKKYTVDAELAEWLQVYADESERAANEHCDRLYISRPIAYRAIAPTGSIGIMASTTTGIEPLYAVAYKRRYLTDGTKWKYEYVIDSVAEHMINTYGLDPSSIQTARDLAAEPETRIAFQADVQDYVDMSISSTINLPPWGSKDNNEDGVEKFAAVLAKYAPRLRGFTCYPDGSRGGQPLTSISHEEAIKHRGVVFEETDICQVTGKGGSCGV